MRFLLLIPTFILILNQAFAADKPNIIIFLVDDMGLMDTSVPFITDGNGTPVRQPLNNWYHTPGMERLAEKGIRFSNFYSHTVCSPTRISIMTGQNAVRHHTTNWINPTDDNKGKWGPPNWNWKGLTKDDITLPKVLKKAGYHTIHVGKAHFGPMESEGEDPLNLGFNVNIAGHAWGSPGSYYGKQSYGNEAEGRKGLRGVPGLEKYHNTKTFLTEALTIEAKKEIDKAVDKKLPFYLYMAHYAVHAPFETDQRFIDHYNNSDKSDNAKAFATLIEGMDKSLGDLMDHLEKLGIADNTLILFLGDNGSDAPLGGADDIASSAPLRGKKGSKWEGGTRVPFIAAWGKNNPKNPWQKKFPIEKGAVQEQMGACFDLFPTVLEVAGASVSGNYIINGQTLTKLITGRKDKKRKNVYLSHFPHWHRSNMFTTYREDNWKIIYKYFPELEELDSHYSLYNLKEDPTELNNLADQNPGKVKSMMQAMINDMQAKEALYPVKDGKEVRPLLPD